MIERGSRYRIYHQLTHHCRREAKETIFDALDLLCGSIAEQVGQNGKSNHKLRTNREASKKADHLPHIL
jgi:hypothetical protein